MERKSLIVLCIIATSIAVCSALKANVNTKPEVANSRIVANGNIEHLPKEAVASSSQHRSAPNEKRKKRAIIFRPLFVYRQQEIKKQKLHEMRQQQQQQQLSAQTNKQNACIGTPMPVRFYAQSYPYQQG
ncbi:uncharacterized protein LOC126576070 [Anopheles aquasalis]|uniref:uncharacterized protein LOC126576070 n=1 Tax=Anopheles aquasalis TaxID=42839 RepID=UPI00215ADA82|nr:uncharacterized protein LOC126576070 [Anopheles aquasalis]